MKKTKLRFLLILIFNCFLNYGQINIYNKEEKVLKLNIKKELLIKTLDSLYQKGKEPYYIQRRKNGKIYRCKIIRNKIQQFLI